MPGSINLGTFQTADGGMVTLSLSYNDTLAALQFTMNNNSASSSFAATLQGVNPDNTPNPNAIYSLLVGPNSSGVAMIPPTGVKAIQLAVNAKGKVAGFNLATG